MGERKGTNKYYPPDFDPAKHGSLNKYHGSHPLRERARKLAQGILIIRFEMPYNIWCDGCKNHIGMGVRYNVEKQKVGNYYSTPIYRFRMKCHLCAQVIEIQTDPASCDYVIVSGARRKEERWDMKDNEQLPTTERDAKEKLASDAMFRLEHGEADRTRLLRATPGLATLQRAQEAWRDDFGLNCRLRQRFREEKRQQQREEEEEAQRGRAGLSIPLLPHHDSDRRLAELLRLQSPCSPEEQQLRRRREISARPWLPSAAPGGKKTGETLRKMGLGGRGFFGGPSQTLPHPSPTPQTPAALGIVRRGGKGEGGTSWETPGERREEEEEEEEEEEGGEGAPQKPISPPPTQPIPPTPPQPIPPSLVPDYSDSSSEPGTP